MIRLPAGAAALRGFLVQAHMSIREKDVGTTAVAAGNVGFPAVKTLFVNR